MSTKSINDGRFYYILNLAKKSKLFTNLLAEDMAVHMYLWVNNITSYILLPICSSHSVEKLIQLHPVKQVIADYGFHSTS